jgi:hypothetical protein
MNSPASPKKVFTIYGNCQAYGIGKTLLEVGEFSKEYEWEPMTYIQAIEAEDIDIAKDILSRSTLILFQHISDAYRIPQLSTSSMLAEARQAGKILISFPSFYFNAYFPHLRPSRGIDTPLDMIDMNMLVAWLSQMSIDQTLHMISSEDFYPKDLSIKALEHSFSELRHRESSNGTTVSVADFIQEHWQTRKLFNQFNHSKGPLVEHACDQILKILDIDGSKYWSHPGRENTYMDGIEAPIYKSTCENLDLSFPEDYDRYRCKDGRILNTSEIIAEYFNIFENSDINVLVKMANQIPECIENVTHFASNHRSRQKRWVLEPSTSAHADKNKAEKSPLLYNEGTPPKPLNLQGSIDRIDDKTVLGWCWNKDNPNEKPTIYIYVDNIVAGSTIACLPRNDLAASGIGDGCYGFIFNLENYIDDRKSYTIEAKATNADGVCTIIAKKFINAQCGILPQTNLC